MGGCGNDEFRSEKIHVTVCFEEVVNFLLPLTEEFTN